MFNKLRHFLSALALIGGLAAFGFAQDRFGEIDGTVTDSTGAVIPNATVTIQGNAFNRTVQANAEGYYRVLAVPPGTYKVIAKATGFGDSTATTATVILGEATPVNFTLSPATATAQVNVTGDVAAIDTTSSLWQDNITSKRFEEIPKGTNFTSVLQTASGVQSESKGAGIQIEGSSGAETPLSLMGRKLQTSEPASSTPTTTSRSASLRKYRSKKVVSKPSTAAQPAELLHS